MVWPIWRFCWLVLCCFAIVFSSFCFVGVFLLCLWNWIKLNWLGVVGKTKQTLYRVDWTRRLWDKLHTHTLTHTKPEPFSTIYRYPAPPYTAKLSHFPFSWEYGRFSICGLACTCVLADLWNVISRSPSTVPIQSPHPAKYSPNTRMWTCSACSLGDASGGDLCGLLTARYPRMHFSQTSGNGSNGGGNQNAQL